MHMYDMYIYAHIYIDFVLNPLDTSPQMGFELKPPRLYILESLPLYQL